MSEQAVHVPHGTTALEVLNRARAYAEQFGDEEIGPHHLVLGVLSHRNIVVKRVLDAQRIDLGRAVERFDERWGNSKNPSVIIRLRYDDSAWEVLLVALDEAIQRGRDEIDAVDILFALADRSKRFPADMEVVLDLLTHAHKDGTELSTSQVVEAILDAVTRHYQPVYG